MASFMPRGTGSVDTVASQVAVNAMEAAKSQIEAVYAALTAAEDLPEMEPTASVITNMYKHQKQALYFMTEREKRVDYTKYDPKTSMWRFETYDGSFRNVITNERSTSIPPQSKGGILADDMGLGKTIEVISLIMSNRVPSGTPIPATPAANGVSSMTPLLQAAVPELEPIEGGENLVKSWATLIVCPLSTVQNWEEQFAAHVQKDSVTMHVYHGQSRIQDPRELAKFVSVCGSSTLSF
jgi:SNF2 family DNA or RNA helicase